ncbi:hypothetical protein L0128_15015 [candidate division KSB1 bacterium]|nr:hypothetical protein [candidate division KSB1 bacterium]
MEGRGPNWQTSSIQSRPEWRRSGISVQKISLALTQQDAIFPADGFDHHESLSRVSGLEERAAFIF